MYLNCHTKYSFHYGLLSEEELCSWALQNQVGALGITDINSTTACLNFFKTAKQYNIKPLLGVDFRNGNNSCYIGIAKTNFGFYQLNRYLSHHLQHKKKFPKQAPALKDCFFIYPFQQVLHLKKLQFETTEYIGISLKDLNQLKFSDYKNYKDRLVFQQPVTLRNKRDFNTHRLLRAIGLNQVLSKLPRSEEACLSDRMYPVSYVKEAFADFEFILTRTQNLIDQCHVHFEWGKNLNKNLQVFTKSKKEDARQLRTLVKKHYKKRYPHPDFKTLRRIATELQTVEKLGFAAFFLINLDIINYAKSKNFAYIGRGSGANSVIAYILDITQVDPIELNLYFERFINTNRSSPPDFDLDFSWRDRDEVIHYVLNRYPNTALMGAYVTFKRKAVMRELGKVFGLPKANLDKLSSGIFTFDQLDSIEKLVLRYSSYIEGLPNYISVHSGGILILEEPIHHFAATFLPPKGFPTAQIDMNIAEEVGIHKFDLLAQRGLPKIMDALDLIKKNQPYAKCLAIKRVAIFKKDPKINNLLKKGDCMGVFYVESPPMRGLLIKLQTDNYLDLVAASSIIRPGVSSSGIKKEYIRRHRYPEKRKEAHPILYQIMPETYGVMVYQEDVMKVAHYFAGLNLDDADVLRRGMSGKKTSKSQMQRIEDKFRVNCKNRGYSPELTEEIWKQISSFAGYAFPKGHSASYAVESYQSLYLKAYFPLEFMVAVINNGGGFYDLQTYLQEIRNHGGKVEPPHINKSDFELKITGKTVYLGLGFLRELEFNTIQRILENRNFQGDFTSLKDFIDRIPISIEQIRILIRIDAFRFTQKNKYRLLWEAHFILQKQAVQIQQKQLFKSPTRTFEYPEFEASFLIDAYDQMELLGFPLCHPFQLLKQPVENRICVEDLYQKTGETITIYGYLITVRKIRTSNGKPMYFASFYDRKFQIFDTVHFPFAAQKFPVYGKGSYKCIGKVTEEFGYISIQIQAIYKMEIKNDFRYSSTSQKPTVIKT